MRTNSLWQYNHSTRAMQKTYVCTQRETERRSKTRWNSVLAFFHLDEMIQRVCMEQTGKKHWRLCAKHVQIECLEERRAAIGSTHREGGRNRDGKTTQHIKLFLSFNLMIFALKSRVLSNNKWRETAPRMRLIQCIPDAKDTLNDFLCVIRAFFLYVFLALLLLLFLFFLSPCFPFSWDSWDASGEFYGLSNGNEHRCYCHSMLRSKLQDFN